MSRIVHHTVDDSDTDGAKWSPALSPPVSLRLRLFGAIHADRRGKVREEFDRVADGVDAVFLEYPVDGLGFRQPARALVRAPLAAVGLLLVSVLQWPLYALLVRAPHPAEVVAAREFAAAHDLPIHPVDDHPVSTLATAGLRVAVPNWLGLAAVAVLDPLGTFVVGCGVVGTWTVGSALGRVDTRLWSLVAPPLTAGAAWLLLVSGRASSLALFGAVVALFVAVVVTLESRNDVMIERIVAHADREGYETAVLTTGRAHLPGLRTAARELGVTVESEYLPRLARRGQIRSEPDATTTPVADPATAERVLGRRLAAGAVDLVGAVLAGGAAAVAVALVALAGADGVAALVLAPAVAVACFAYYAVPEAVWGKTPGKAVFGLVVVDTEGRPIGRFAAGFRTILRLVDVPTLYLTAVIGLWEGRQRLGDRAADTVVARAGSDPPEDATDD